MAMEYYSALPDSGCLADYFGRQVDEALNGGARQEAEDATDALQSPDQETLSDQSQSLYINEAVVFPRRTGVCTDCKRTATLSPDGSVEAAYCKSTGSCEIEWALNHPELYQNSEGEPLASSVLCRGLQCNVTLGWEKNDAETDMVPIAINGICTVVNNGVEYHRYKRTRLNSVGIEEHPPERAYEEAEQIRPIQNLEG